MTERPLCSISIDVDPIACYYAIHGLGPAPDELRDLVMRRCVPRFAELLARHGIRATFFLVAQDIDVAAGGGRARAARSLIAELVAAGHEIANHSYSHPYDLARLPAARIADEIGRADDLLAAVAGKRISGFRAPGYDLSPAIIDQLDRLGYAYDSSVFPAPGYYVAKAAVVGAMRLGGRSTGAVLTSPWLQLAPADPYRLSPQRPWRRGDGSVVELPIAVTPTWRLPVIGTSLLLAPEWLRSSWIRAMQRRPHFCLELHAIDLADADDDGIPGLLVARQPDLRATLARKLAAFEASLADIARSFELATVAEVAQRVAASLPRSR